MRQIVGRLGWGQVSDWLDRGSRWLLAAVFLAASVPKMLNPSGFAATIGAYGLLPAGLLFPTAILLSWGEFITALGLIGKRRWAILATACFLFLFIAVLAYGIALGLDIDCGCFGPDDPEHKAFSGLRTALVRDLLLLIPLAWSICHAFFTLKHNGEKS